jgi:plastocyanin
MNESSHLNQTERETGTQGVPVIQPPSPRRRGPGKWLIAAVILVVIGVASVLLVHNRSKQGAQAESATAAVQITDTAFVPETIKIKQGQSVTWTNTDISLHQVAADPYPSHSKLPSLFSQESLSQNETYTFTFDKAGTYTYHDPLNPTALKATVIVE